MINNHEENELIIKLVINSFLFLEKSNMQQFIDEVHDYQSFIIKNFNKFGNLEIIQEQYTIKSGIIDILAYDKLNERIVIVELKNKIVDSTVIAQVMRYYHDIKGKQIDDYIISELPIIYIIASEFDNIIITQNMPIKFFTFDRFSFQEYYPYIEDFEDDLNGIFMPKLSVKKQISINLNEDQKDLIKRLLRYFQGYTIIEHKDHIDILDKKIIAKIIYPKGWFNSTIILNLYKKRLNMNIINLAYDPAVKQFNQSKTLVKLLINDVPYSLFN